MQWVAGFSCRSEVLKKRRCGCRPFCLTSSCRLEPQKLRLKRGFEEFEEREKDRGCPVGPVRSVAVARGRRRFRLTRACRYEFAEKTKTKVEEMRERHEDVCV